MGAWLLAVIYLIFISLGLPDSLLGSGWPVMQISFGVPSSYAGYVSMTISFMTIISAILSPQLIKRFNTKWIVIVSIFMTVLGLLGFSVCRRYWMLFLFAVPYGLGAGSIDASVNHYVANHYSSSVMNFLHCFYGVVLDLLRLHSYLITHAAVVLKPEYLCRCISALCRVLI